VNKRGEIAVGFLEANHVGVPEQAFEGSGFSVAFSGIVVQESTGVPACDTY
jgi:hypothetical protein